MFYDCATFYKAIIICCFGVVMVGKHGNVVFPDLLCCKDDGSSISYMTHPFKHPNSTLTI